MKVAQLSPWPQGNEETDPNYDGAYFCIYIGGVVLVVVVVAAGGGPLRAPLSRVSVGPALELRKY